MSQAMRWRMLFSYTHAPHILTIKQCITEKNDITMQEQVGVDHHI